MVTSIWAPPQISSDLVLFQIKIFCLFISFAALHISSNKFRTAGRFTLEKAKELDGKLNTAQKLYRNIIILGIILSLLTPLGIGEFKRPLTLMFICFCMFVALYDALRWYKNIAEHVLGKALIGLGFAVGSTLAYAIARQQISEVIFISPTNFTHTTILAAILSIPVLLALAGGVIYISCILLSVLVIPLLVLMKDAASLTNLIFAGTIRSTEIAYPVITKVFQFAFYAALGSFIVNMSSNAGKAYDAKIKNLMPGAIYYLDMYYSKECRLSRGEKLAALGDSKFLIAQKNEIGDIRFLEPVKCDDLTSRPPTIK